MIDFIDLLNKRVENLFNNNSKKQVKDKLTILYILNGIDKPILKADITELIMENELLNYFELQLYLTELEDGNLLEVSVLDNSQYFLVTEKGKATLELFDDILIPSFISELDIFISNKLTQLKKFSEMSATYSKLGETDYQVKLSIKEDVRVILDVDLNLISSDQARIVVENFKNNTDLIYKKILEVLLDEAI